ncbi:hypothetical protein Y032_0255g342 [Ancylostoma ceylanicum]|uniref:Endonuclease/exonuclease/phosphatase domain-containing protein n=1 Tax=Ancylostoma ceylanicum TaxID=53326 RepID=A0A016SB80_9BILA|nr:hypothetical protein Y032_0255g342 [Ancylostoma ceylanicum]
MNLGTYNARTLNSEAALSFLFDELHNIKIDIVAVCETRRVKDMSVKWNDGSGVMHGAAKNGVAGCRLDRLTVCNESNNLDGNCFAPTCDFEAQDL